MGRVRAVSALLVWLGTGPPAWAQSDPGAPAGPCSPYAAADGDIPSELPGCSRRRRPAPGSLDDELAFRRARRGADPDPGADDAADEDLPRARRPRLR